MAWPRWFRRAARNRHRHAIEQASRRWRGGRRCDSARTRRKILISTQRPTRAPRRARPPGLIRAPHQQRRRRPAARRRLRARASTRTSGALIYRRAAMVNPPSPRWRGTWRRGPRARPALLIEAPRLSVSRAASTPRPQVTKASRRAYIYAACAAAARAAPPLILDRRRLRHSPTPYPQHHHRRSLQHDRRHPALLPPRRRPHQHSRRLRQLPSARGGCARRPIH